MTDLPAAAVPYVLRAGRGLRDLVAGQMIRTLARTEQTAGGFGAVCATRRSTTGKCRCIGTSASTIPGMLSAGKLQVWCGEVSRVLTPGDFAYVAPGDTILSKRRPAHAIFSASWHPADGSSSSSTHAKCVA